MSAMCSGQGDRQKAHRLLMEASEVYQDIGDAMLGQYVQIDSAWQVWGRGSLREGLAMMEDYLDYQRQIHFKWAVSDALSGLYWMNLILGEYAQALRLAEENLAVRRSTLIDKEEAWGHYDLGQLEFSLGNFKVARQWLDLAFRIFQKLQDKWGVCAALNYLGLAAVFEGRLGEGLAQLEESMRSANVSRTPTITLLSIICCSLVKPFPSKEISPGLERLYAGAWSGLGMSMRFHESPRAWRGWQRWLWDMLAAMTAPCCLARRINSARLWALPYGQSISQLTKNF